MSTDTVPETDEQDAPDCVIVFKEINEDGSITAKVGFSGNVQATEVETLLGMGRKAWRESHDLL